MNQPVTIVGGGLAGLTLGIALRRREVPVTVWEAGEYPRHRVCGEFICGRGQETLARLGLMDRLLDAGGRWARTAAFFAPGIAPVKNVLPRQALCLSRYRLDALLAGEFRRAGGDLREHQRWTGSWQAEGVVCATGHRVEPVVDGWRWLGLKAHARDVRLDADLELHLLPNGYVGLCRLADEVNVCGLFRTQEAVPDLRSRWREWLAGETGSALHDRLARAEFDDDSFRAVAGLCLKPQRANARGECRLGDALTMIPPATGNGMSLAFESTELAVEPLARFAGGEQRWDETRREIAGACNRRFAVRLRTAATLDKVMFSQTGRRIVLALLHRIPGAWPALFALTR